MNVYKVDGKIYEVGTNRQVYYHHYKECYKYSGGGPSLTASIIFDCMLFASVGVTIAYTIYCYLL